MGGGNSKSKTKSIAQRLAPKNPDWIYSDGIKIEEKNVEQYKDHGSTCRAICKIPVQSIRVKILPSQSYFFVGLVDTDSINPHMIGANGIKNLQGVYGLGLSENEVVMNGQPTRYKRPPISNGDIVAFKYEKDRIFFKIGTEWDLLYVVGEGKQFTLCTEMCHLYSRLTIIEQMTMEEYKAQNPPQ